MPVLRAPPRPNPTTFVMLAARARQLDEMATELELVGAVVLLQGCIELVFDHYIGGEEAGAYVHTFKAALATEREAGEEVRRGYRLSSTHRRKLNEVGQVLELSQSRVVELLIEALHVEGGPWDGPKPTTRQQLERLLRIIYSSDPLDGDKEATRAAEHGAPFDSMRSKS